MKILKGATPPPRGSIIYLVQYTTGDGYYVLMPGQDGFTIFDARKYLKECRKKYPKAAAQQGTFRIQAYMPELFPAS